jgi:two-component system, OmpR family, heavy metal sensor histidine kinase CusS
MRVRLEEIQASRRMFASMLLHDLNTPVNNMVMLLESVAEKLPDAKSAQRVARAITEGKRANRMLGTLLDIERIEAQKLELNRRPIEWKHLVQLVIRSLEDRAEQKKLGVVCEISNFQSDFRLMCDEMLMERVLVNLVENAVQHADPGTSIEIRNEIQRQGNRRVLVCGVLNEGPVISAAEQEKLFGLFAQVRKDDLNEKREGFGLGVFFCKLALEAHGGAIRCVSPVPGKETGVMFEFRLPLDEPAN